MESTVSRLQSYYEKTVFFLPLSPREFQKLISLTSEGWKAESTLEPPSAKNSLFAGETFNRRKHFTNKTYLNNFQTDKAANLYSWC